MDWNTQTAKYYDVYLDYITIKSDIISGIFIMFNYDSFSFGVIYIWDNPYIWHPIPLKFVVDYGYRIKEIQPADILRRNVKLGCYTVGFIECQYYSNVEFFCNIYTYGARIRMSYMPETCGELRRTFNDLKLCKHNRPSDEPDIM